MNPDETEPAGPAAAEARPSRGPVDDPRIYLAAERTFLAWVRTSIALMGFGFLIARFSFWIREYATLAGGTSSIHDRPSLSHWFGFGMVVVGVFVCVMAAVRHGEYIHALKEGVANPPLGIRAAVGVAAILALVGLAMAVQILLF